MAQARDDVYRRLVPTSFLQALYEGLSEDGRIWLATRRDEARVLEEFVQRMAEELAANSHKGDRPAWLAAGPDTMVSESLYHLSKLTYAARQLRQGDGPPEKVREFAADVANCALMVADCAGVLDA